MRLKSIRVDDEFLYISNFRKEIRVSIRDISGIFETRFATGHPITIELSRHTDFGDRIVFIPPLRWWGGRRSDTIMDELRRAANRAGARLKD